jgi:hypothetical protein
MRARCEECGYTVTVSRGSPFDIPDQYVKECKHPPERRSTKEFKARDADCSYLIDHIVGESDERGRQLNGEHLGRFRVDDEVEARRLLERQIRWSRSLEDLLSSSNAEQTGKVSRVRRSPIRVGQGCREQDQRVSRGIAALRRDSTEQKPSTPDLRGRSRESRWYLLNENPCPPRNAGQI